MATERSRRGDTQCDGASPQRETVLGQYATTTEDSGGVVKYLQEGTSYQNNLENTRLYPPVRI